MLFRAHVVPARRGRRAPRWLALAPLILALGSSCTAAGPLATYNDSLHGIGELTSLTGTVVLDAECVPVEVDGAGDTVELSGMQLPSPPVPNGIDIPASCPSESLRVVTDAAS
jgi:hypothetical protein